MSASLPEQPFSSTTWVWKRVKISRAPEARVTVAQRASFWRRYRPRNPRDPINVTLKLRGGSECWVEVRGRGSVGRYPGTTAIYDILLDINSQPRL